MTIPVLPDSTDDCGGGGGGGGADTDYYQAVQDEGVDLVQRLKLNFIGAAITAADNPITLVTDVTVSGDGLGSVTSVAETVPVEFTISGSPITNAGTLAIGKATEIANTVWAGPTTGADAQPTFRALVTADLPPGGSVTSVAETVPVEFTISGSPITSSGTLVIGKATETANTVWAGPTTGAAAEPTFRALVAADIPPGPIITNITTIINNYNLGATDETILANTTSNSITVTLPASPDQGRNINVKKIAAPNTLTIDGNGHTIDGSATFSTTAIYKNKKLHYDTSFGWAIL